MSGLTNYKTTFGGTTGSYDLSLIFQPYSSSGTQATATNILVKGSDLNTIFAAYTTGSQVNTTYITVNGKDLNAIFAPINYPPFTITNGSFSYVNNIYTIWFTDTSSTANCGIVFYENIQGTLLLLGAGSGGSGSGLNGSYLYGGGGGGAGELYYNSNYNFTSSYSISIASGGNGGAAVTSASSSGNNGGSGIGNTTFGSSVTAHSATQNAYFIRGGSGGSTDTGGTNTGDTSGSNGTNANYYYGGGGGGSGAGVNTNSQRQMINSSGDTISGKVSNNGGGGGGIGININSTALTNGTLLIDASGGYGGLSGYSTNAQGGNYNGANGGMDTSPTSVLPGNAASYGGGGGGGSFSYNNTKFTGSAGGSGGNGICVIQFYYPLPFSIINGNYIYKNNMFTLWFTDTSSTADCGITFNSSISGTLIVVSGGGCGSGAGGGASELYYNSNYNFTGQYNITIGSGGIISNNGTATKTSFYKDINSSIAPAYGGNASNSTGGNGSVDAGSNSGGTGAISNDGGGRTTGPNGTDGKQGITNYSNYWGGGGGGALYYVPTPPAYQNGGGGGGIGIDINSTILTNGTFIIDVSGGYGGFAAKLGSGGGGVGGNYGGGYGGNGYDKSTSISNTPSYGCGGGGEGFNNRAPRTTTRASNGGDGICVIQFQWPQ